MTEIIKKMTFSGRFYLFLDSSTVVRASFLSRNWIGPLGKPEGDYTTSPHIPYVIKSLAIHQDAKCTINLIFSHETLSTQQIIAVAVYRIRVTFVHSLRLN